MRRCACARRSRSRGGAASRTRASFRCAPCARPREGARRCRGRWRTARCRTSACENSFSRRLKAARVHDDLATIDRKCGFEREFGGIGFRGVPRSFPLPAKRGEGGETRSVEPGEGLLHGRSSPSPASHSLGTLSPLRGAREYAAGSSHRIFDFFQPAIRILAARFASEF